MKQNGKMREMYSIVFDGEAFFHLMELESPTWVHCGYTQLAGIASIKRLWKSAEIDSDSYILPQ